MDSIVIKKFFTENLDSIFSYSYSLVPDELLAQQLAVDSVTQIICSETDKVMGENEFLVQLYKVIFALATRRSGHFVNSGNWENDERAYFYRLPLKQKAIVCLRENFNFSTHQIAFIIDESVDSIQAEYLQIQSKFKALLGSFGESHDGI